MDSILNVNNRRRDGPAQTPPPEELQETIAGIQWNFTLQSHCLISPIAAEKSSTGITFVKNRIPEAKLNVVGLHDA
jgi:hypothetical protein